MKNGTHSSRDWPEALATNVSVNEERLAVALSDGRTVGAPLAWFPRLQEGTPKERRHYELIGRGIGIHWPDLDEDISVQNLLEGQKSGESKSSLAAWRKQRQKSKAPVAH